MKQITKLHALQVYVVVKKVENLRHWVVFVCVCVRACACVVSLAVLRFRFSVCSGGLVVSLYDTHEAHTLGRSWYAILTVGRDSYIPSFIMLLSRVGGGEGKVQPVYHTVYTSPARCIKTRITASSIITPHRLNDFNSQDFNHKPLLTLFMLILTEIVIILIFME
jgi:hypothetical protein